MMAGEVGRGAQSASRTDIPTISQNCFIILHCVYLRHGVYEGLEAENTQKECYGWSWTNGNERKGVDALSKRLQTRYSKTDIDFGEVNLVIGVPATTATGNVRVTTTTTGERGTRTGRDVHWTNRWVLDGLA